MVGKVPQQPSQRGSSSSSSSSSSDSSSDSGSEAPRSHSPKKLELTQTIIGEFQIPMTPPKNACWISPKKTPPMKRKRSLSQDIETTDVEMDPSQRKVKRKQRKSLKKVHTQQSQELECLPILTAPATGDLLFQSSQEFGVVTEELLRQKKFISTKLAKYLSSEFNVLDKKIDKKHNATLYTIFNHVPDVDIRVHVSQLKQIHVTIKYKEDENTKDNNYKIWLPENTVDDVIQTMEDAATIRVIEGKQKTQNFVRDFSWAGSRKMKIVKNHEKVTLNYTEYPKYNHRVQFGLEYLQNFHKSLTQARDLIRFMKNNRDLTIKTYEAMKGKLKHCKREMTPKNFFMNNINTFHKMRIDGKTHDIPAKVGFKEFVDRYDQNDNSYFGTKNKKTGQCSWLE